MQTGERAIFIALLLVAAFSMAGCEAARTAAKFTIGCAMTKGPCGQ